MSLNNYESLIRKGLRKISSLQNNDGAFFSTLLPNITHEYTTFITSLILQSIASAPEDVFKKSIADRALPFLKNQFSNQLTVNYYPRSIPSPYPDDLDDTCAALTAIYVHDPEWINEERMISLINILTAQETSPGGPYQTWIVSPHHKAQWNNVDSVVNNAINILLKKLTIAVKPLEGYLHERIVSHDFSSEFYHLPLVAIYFLTKDNDRQNNSMLIEAILKQKRRNNFGSSIIETVLATSSLLRLGYSPKKLQQYITKIAQLLEKSSLPAEPLFIERKINNQYRYSGSTAFLYAAIVECLSLYQEKMNTAQVRRKDRSSKILGRSRTLCLNLFKSYPDIQPVLREHIDVLLQSERRKNLALIPWLFMQSLSVNTHDDQPMKTSIALCAATLLGDIGFTLVDDIGDAEATPDQISFALLCIQSCQEFFLNEFPRKYHHDVSRILGIMQYANFQERATRYRNQELPIMSLKNIPRYEPLELISDKSLGYFLGPLCTCRTLFPDDDVVVILLEKFFKKIITVRQLHDDAHDWYDDLCKGFINPVGSMILRSYARRYAESSINLSLDKEKLETLFWRFIFKKITSHIKDMLDEAEHLLTSLNHLCANTILWRLLQDERRSLEKTIHDHHQLNTFLKLYAKK